MLLFVSGNDVLQRVKPDTIHANITATIDKLKVADIPVVLIAQPHFSVGALFGKTSDNPIYKDIANLSLIGFMPMMQAIDSLMKACMSS